MRKTERPVYDQRRGVIEKPGNAVNFCAFQSLFKTQLRKDRSQPSGQHGLARTRRTEHQQIMGSRRGHFKRPFDMLLSLDVLEIFAEDLPFLKKPAGVIGSRLNLLLPLKIAYHLIQGTDRDSADFLDHGCFRLICLGQDQLFKTMIPCRNRDRKDAPNRPDRPIE